MVNQENGEMEQKLKGKTCLVTGATAGIGKVTAAALAAQGATVVIAGRTSQKLEETLQDIYDHTGSESVEYVLANFTNLQEVRSMAEDFKNRFGQLDVLVNNAGAFFNRRYETPYGIEKTLLVNHLAPFVLTTQLLDLIQASAPARIVNVSSEGHRQSTMDFDDLGFKQGYFGMRAYGRSKLANILFSYELARRLEGSDVTVNAVHPGHVATDIWRTSFSFIGPALKWIMGLFSLTPEEGAAPVIYLACSPEVEGLTGKYFNRQDLAKSSEVSYDQEIARRLWEESERMAAL